MLVITFVSADWRDSVISMTAELQQAVDTGDLCQGLGDKPYRLAQTCYHIHLHW